MGLGLIVLVEWTETDLYRALNDATDSTTSAIKANASKEILHEQKNVGSAADKNSNLGGLRAWKHESIWKWWRNTFWTMRQIGFWVPDTV